MRIHRGTAAAGLAEHYSARAFTYGSHIVLGDNAPGLETLAGRRLLAHELTHTLQQASPYARGEVSAEAMPRGPPSMASRLSIGQRTAGLGVQCDITDITVGDVTGAVVDFGVGAYHAARDVGGAAIDMASAGFETVVEYFAPGLLAFVRGGYVGQLTDLFCTGLDSLVGSLISPLENIDIVSSITETFNSLTAGVNGVKNAIGSAASTAIGSLMRPVVQAIQVYGDPILQGITSVADTIEGIFTGLWDNIAVPVLDFLGTVGGAIWSAFNDLITWIEDITAPLRRAAAWAWDQLCEQFNLAWNATGGIRKWFSDTAQDIWKTFQDTIEPIKTPLMVVGGILLLLSPFGPIIIVTQVLPPLYDKLVWLWNNWNTDDILVQAREILAHEILPAIIGTVSTVSSAIAGAISWLAGITANVSEAFGGVLSVFGANHCLAAVTRVLNHIADQFQRLADWARGGFKGLGDAVTAVFNAIVAIFQPILDFLVRLLIAASNPPMIPVALAAAIWLLCPDELKPPVIDFIIDLLIQFTRVFSAFMVSLWPLNALMKEAAIGFLEELRGNGAGDTARKIAVTNKIANLLAGGGLSFAAGFVVGLLEGLLDGILDPFRIIIMIVQLVAAICRALGNIIGPLIARLSPAAGGVINDYRTSLDAAPFPTGSGATAGGAGTTATAPAIASSSGVAGATAAPPPAAPTAEAAPSTGPPPEVAAEIERYRAAAIASAQYAPPTPRRAYSHRTVPVPPAVASPPAPVPTDEAVRVPRAPASTDAAAPAAPAGAAADTATGPPPPASAADAALAQDETLASLVGPGPLPSDADVAVALTPDMAGELSQSGSELSSVTEGGEAEVAGEMQATGGSPRALSQVLGDLWDTALTGAANLGARIAGALMEFILQPDYVLGRKLGYVAGFVLFQVILAYFTAGISAEAEACSPILKAIVRFLDLGGEILGLIGKAAGRVAPMVMRFLGPVGRFLGRFRFLDRIMSVVGRAVRGLARFGERAGGAVVGAARRLTDPLGAAAMHAAGFTPSAISHVMSGAGRHVAGDVATSAISHEGGAVASHAGTSAVAHDAGGIARAEGRAVEGTGGHGATGAVDDAGSRAARDTADSSASRHAAGDTEGAAGREARTADEAAHEPRPADEAADLARRKETELPAAMAAARAITDANDIVDTPTPLLLAQLLALKGTYPWIITFVARSTAPGHFRIVMRASEHEIKSDYDTGTTTSATDVAAMGHEGEAVPAGAMGDHVQLDTPLTGPPNPTPATPPDPTLGTVPGPNPNPAPPMRGSTGGRPYTSTRRTTRPLSSAPPTPEVVPVRRPARPTGEFTPTAAEDAAMAESRVARDRALEEHRGLPEAEQGRTVATSSDPTRPPSTSGGYSAADPAGAGRVEARAQQTGHDFAPHAHDPPDAPGRYHASHAEKQTIVDSPHGGAGVSRDQCEDCIRFFQREAQTQGRTIAVSDPSCDRLFYPDGSITEYWHHGAIVRYRADGSVSVVSGVVQRKLVMGGTHDRFEQEADRCATFATSHAPLGLRPTISPFRPTLARATGGLPSSPRPPPTTFAAPPSTGAPLPAIARTHMESRFGVDFRSVRVHADSEAAHLSQGLSARAFTQGSHIYFAPGQYHLGSSTGTQLLAHELTHVVQQSAVVPGTRVVQRQPDDTTDDTSDPYADVDEPLEDEKPRFKWINYDEAARKNRVSFDTLAIRDINPFSPYDPYNTPNAYVNHVTLWQLGAKKGKLGELVFAAENQKEQDTLDLIEAGVIAANEKAVAGKVSPGPAVNADGVLGARTLWAMMAAAALARNPKSRKVLEKNGIDVVSLEPLTHDERGEWGAAWRAVNATLFNKPKFRATWSTLARSDVVFDYFEKTVALGDANRTELESMFFPEGPPKDPELTDEDYMAIMARGYLDQALDGVVSLFEVDRAYFHNVDVQQLLQKERPKWNQNLDVRFGTAIGSDAQEMIDALSIDVPKDTKAQATYEKLQAQTVSSGGAAQTGDGKLAVLAIVFALPDQPPEFWTKTAQDYVTEKKALDEAAEKATQEHLAELQKKFEDRMGGAPDITKDDAMAFLELLVGDTFTSAQDDALSLQKKDAAKNDVDIIGKRQESTSATKAATLREKAEKEGFLVVQLGDKPESKFPLPFLQIERSRESAAVNGKAPLPFDVIDTPHAAMHQYLPSRFTARTAGDGGSEAAINPYELTFDSTKPGSGSGNAWENWAYFAPREYATFDPVLVEIRQFNPDAGQLVRLGRQIGGTDKIVLQYVWTLGSSLPELNKSLWSAQGTVNLFGWIDAGLTLIALGSLVAAPLAAATEASGSAAAAELGQAAINAAIRKALVQALKRFIIQEAIGEALGRLTYYINDDPDVPVWLKKAWNGLMIAVLIYGLSKTVRQGIKGFRNSPTAKFQAQFAALEAEIEAQSKAGGGKVNNVAELAAEAEIQQKTKEKFNEAVGDQGGPETGPGRVRTDDPRAGATVKPDAALPDSAAATTKLSSVLGEDAAKALAEKVKPSTLARLAALGDEAVIRKLAESLTPELLDRVLATVAPETLTKLAQKLEAAVLKALLDAFAGSSQGVDLLRVFANDPLRLSALFDKVGAKRLLAIAANPGAEKFYRLASRVDPAAIADTLKNIAPKADTQLARFRQLITDLGPEGAADVLNTYTGAEIKSRWKPKEGMSAAQNLGRLAIQRGEPTKARVASGIPITPAPVRTPHLLAGDFRAFFAIGPEATLPSTIRRLVSLVQEASAKAANRLNELIERSAAGTLTDADLQALPPSARATVEAFLKAGAQDGNRHALYGSALQYLAEGELRAQFGGQLPPGVALRRTEVRNGKTLIPDAQLELTLDKDLRYPQTNKSERAVIDWTTAGEAGKITKYRGGKPPVTYAVEIIQPGPPAVPPTVTTPIVVTPTPKTTPDTDVDLNPKK